MLTTTQLEQMSIEDIKRTFTDIMAEIVTEYGDNRPNPLQSDTSDEDEEVEA